MQATYRQFIDMPGCVEAEGGYCGNLLWIQQ